MSVDRVKARIMTVMRNLPPLPEVTRQLMTVMRDEEASAADVAKVLSSDQALAGKVLKVANSSFYGVPNEVTTISRARGTFTPVISILPRSVPGRSSDASTITWAPLLRTRTGSTGIRRGLPLFPFLGIRRHTSWNPGRTPSISKDPSSASFALGPFGLYPGL